MGDANCHLLVACAGSQPVGSVRFDFLHDAAEISIYLDPELAGLGLGTGTLRAAQEWITSRTAHPTRLDAEIHPDNVASTKAFTAAGFSRVGPLNWIWEIPK